MRPRLSDRLPTCALECRDRRRNWKRRCRQPQTMKIIGNTRENVAENDLVHMSTSPGLRNEKKNTMSMKCERSTPPHQFAMSGREKEKRKDRKTTGAGRRTARKHRIL